MKKQTDYPKNCARVFVVLLIAALTAFVLNPSASHAASDKVVKIGVLAPLTGGASADGEEMVRGAKLAAEEINKAGGVNGFMFEVVTGDTKDQVPDAVVSAFKKITSDKAVGCMMTGYASPTNFEIKLMAEINMPYLISANSAQTLAIVGKEPEKYPTVWSLTPSYDAYETELPRVIELWAEKGKLKLTNRKVAIVTSDNPYSKTISEGLKVNFPKYNWTVTVDEMVPFGEVHDWRAIISKIRKDPPDMIVNTDYQPGNEATFMDQLMEDPTQSLVFLQYGPSVPEFVELTQDKSTGVLYNLLGGQIPSSPITQQVAKKFEDAYGVESGPYGHMLYWQVHLYADALKKVGDPQKKLDIGKALSEADKEISSGRLKFDPKTHLAVQGDDYIPILFFQIWEGERNLVFPAKYATGEFRLPPWMK
jgi:branched-chain amino acid transport system substrate-binding protein